MPHYDCIVLGCGGIGSAALAELARRGARVLGLERFPPPHEYGSSHGETRIIRLAYFEHSDYVPLLRGAFAGWTHWEQVSGTQLYHPVGLLQVGPPNGEVVPGVLRSAQQHGLAVTSLSAGDIVARYPAFAVPDGCVGVLEEQAGYLEVEKCIEVLLEQAMQKGAEFWTGVSVYSWHAEGTGVRVESSRGTDTADHVVICPGPWAADLLPNVPVPWQVIRKPLFWFPSQPSYGFGNTPVSGDLPCYLFELPDGIFYGMPPRGAWGWKIGEHTGGDIVTDPLTIDRHQRNSDRDRVCNFLQRCLPAVQPIVARHKVCMYTLTPDQHFVVDRHPDSNRVSFVAGLSGHGFKFAPVLAQVLADWALTGQTAWPVEFLSWRRFR